MKTSGFITESDRYCTNVSFDDGNFTPRWEFQSVACDILRVAERERPLLQKSKKRLCTVRTYCEVSGLNFG